MTLNTFQPEHYQTQIQQVAVINELLLIHIALAVLSYAFCNRICKFITLYYSISKFKGEKFRSKLL